MLAKLTIELSTQDLSYNTGSVFHGYLMQQIDTSYAEFLHYNQINPFSSCIYREKKDENYYWRVCTTNKTAYEQIILPLSETAKKSIYLRHRDAKIGVKQLTVETQSFDELFFSSSKPYKIRLLTPTTYKTGGVNPIFPNIATLLGGVINKVNAHSDNIKMQDERIVEEFLSGLYIRDYNLKTANFDLERIKVKGFMGTIIPAYRGKEDLKNLLSFLMNVSEYTGLGIKTSLGMGGVKIEYAKQ